jgi:hypothetical protein
MAYHIFVTFAIFFALSETKQTLKNEHFKSSTSKRRTLPNNAPRNAFCSTTIINPTAKQNKTKQSENGSCRTVGSSAPNDGGACGAPSDDARGRLPLCSYVRCCLFVQRYEEVCDRVVVGVVRKFFTSCAIDGGKFECVPLIV